MSKSEVQQCSALKTGEQSKLYKVALKSKQDERNALEDMRLQTGKEVDDAEKALTKVAQSRQDDLEKFNYKISRLDSQIEAEKRQIKELEEREGGVDEKKSPAE